MHKILCVGVFLYSLFSGACLFGATLLPVSFVDLPEVSQEADVHSLSTTYCKALWLKIQASGYLSMSSKEFKDTFSSSVAELGRLVENIKNEEPIMIGSQLNLIDKSITDPAMLAVASYFNRDEYNSLRTALTSMSVLGKHKGSDDLDTEANAHVNEVFVYAWGKVKENPEKILAFLIGLVDAAPTCIQGYTVRMLCAVHPPKLKGVVKK